MKKIIVYFICYMFTISVISQTVQIDSITGSQIYVPVFTNGKYSYSQQIILKNKIIENGWSEGAGNITRIRFHFNNSESFANSNNWTIYIGETNKNFFSTTTDWELVENMTMVFTGIIPDPNAIGWYEIILQTPFAYDGLRNIVIAIDENSDNYTPSHTYYSSFTDTINSGIIFYSQGGGAINPDPSAPPAGNLTSSVPVLQLYFDEICPSPSGFSLSTLNATGGNFTWIPNGVESSWNLRYKSTNKLNWSTINEINNSEYSLENLFSIESYIVQIQSACVDTVSEWINPICFTTPEISGFEYSVDWEIFKNKTEGDFSIMNDTLPDLVIKLDSIVTPNYSTGMDKFFSRIRGYIIPRTSGEFSFHFGSDDIGQFWLSTDESDTNSVLAINNDTIQTNLNLNQYTQNLIEGNRYYFEILHYDSVYNDFIKLGWTVPGDTVIKTIKRPFISSCATNVISQELSFLNTDIIGYPGSQHSIICRFSPWNTSDKTISWLSTDENIAIVDEFGVVTLVSEGNCQIVGSMADNDEATDTVNISVWDFQGPFFVKPDADNNTNGHNWENAIDLQSLLKILNTRIDNEIITVYAAGGLYNPTETIDRNISFSINNVRFVGGFSDISTGTDTTLRDLNLYETKLCGDIGVVNESIDNSYHVVTASEKVIIEGISIVNGRASCSTYGTTPGFYTFKNADNGGGVFIPQIKSDVTLKSCKVSNNSAWNSGGGICCTRSSININLASKLSLENCEVNDNIIQQTLISTGGIFNIQVNGNGGGVSMITSTLYSNNTCFFENALGYGYGNAIFLEGARAFLTNTSIYLNTGYYEDLWLKDGSELSLENSTVFGKFVSFYSKANIINSTITGGGYISGSTLANHYLNIDNSFMPGFDFGLIDTTKIGLTVKYSVSFNHLFGNSIYDTISTSIPEYSFLLDSISDNGGQTPTMKLKSTLFNPLCSFGNPIYLGSYDQRGALRQDSVSIGAYQWVKSNGIIGSHDNLNLCLNDSVELSAIVLPEFVSNNEYFITSSDSSSVDISDNTIIAAGEGYAEIIYFSVDGNFTDTCFVNVIGNVSSGLISGPNEVCQGQNGVYFEAIEIENADNYVWMLPDGFAGDSNLDNIYISFSIFSESAEIFVKGVNSCSEGEFSNLYINVNPLPSNAEIIIGEQNVCQEETNVTYETPIIENTSFYLWTLPEGVVGESLSNTITVEFTNNAIDGDIEVKGINDCGEGQSAVLSITVLEKPATPQIFLSDNTLISDSEVGNQWYNQEGLIIGATESEFQVTQDGDYYLIVSLGSCDSDTSNHILVSNTQIFNNPYESVHIYPNPATNQLIVTNAQNFTQIEYQIYDVLGQLLMKHYLNEECIIDISYLTEGVYKMVLVMNENYSVLTFVKK